MLKFNILKDIFSLPSVKIKFTSHNMQSIDNYKKTYKYFTKRHRLKVFQNKSIGVALIDLCKFNTFEDYYSSINGKNSAAYYARKALARDYKFIKIDRNDFLDDIHEINTSSLIRQGKKMSKTYLNKTTHYKNETNYLYYGVVNKEGKLLSYLSVGLYGEFALISQLLGHKLYLNDGIMYLMISKFNEIMFKEYKAKAYKFIMYDTFFGASEGLRKFKEKLGFQAYRVKWLWEN